jgi:hypothetical protein
MMRRWSFVIAVLLACAGDDGGGSGGESTGSSVDSSGAEVGPDTGEDGSCRPSLVDCGACVDVGRMSA